MQKKLKITGFLDRDIPAKTQANIRIYGCALVAVILYFLIYTFVARVTVIPSGSMENTIGTDDMVFSTSVYEDIKRYDIVIFDKDGKLLIKRVIGMPGDKITFTGGSVYINGVISDESFVLGRTYTDKEKNVTVPAGCYFMLGDNREDSSDSRVFGVVEADEIWAKALFRISPKISDIRYRAAEK